MANRKISGKRNVGHLFLCTICSITFFFIQTSFECLASRVFAWLNRRFDRVSKKFISMHRQWNLFILHDWTTEFNTPFQCPAIRVLCMTGLQTWWWLWKLHLKSPPVKFKLVLMTDSEIYAGSIGKLVSVNIRKFRWENTNWYTLLG